MAAWVTGDSADMVALSYRVSSVPLTMTNLVSQALCDMKAQR